MNAKLILWTILTKFIKSVLSDISHFDLLYDEIRFLLTNLAVCCADINVFLKSRQDVDSLSCIVPADSCPAYVIN